METSELIQKSDDWLQVRIGKLTSSEHYRLVADAKRAMTEEELAARPKGTTAKQVVDETLLSEGAMTYIMEVVGEILTGISADSDRPTKEMEHGVFYEPEAAALYERIKGVRTTEVGFIEYNPYVGGSPDRLVGDDGGIEIKCPYANHNHVKNLLLIDAVSLKEEHRDYYWQIISCLLITKRQWWDFVSYSPNFPMSTCIKIIRVYRDQVEDDIRKLAVKLKYSVLKIEEILKQLKEEEEYPW